MGRHGSVSVNKLRTMRMASSPPFVTHATKASSNVASIREKVMVTTQTYIYACEFDVMKKGSVCVKGVEVEWKKVPSLKRRRMRERERERARCLFCNRMCVMNTMPSLLFYQIKNSISLDYAKSSLFP